jgi:hypothetical protein
MQFKYKNINTSALIKRTAGQFAGLMVNSGTASIKVIDGTELSVVATGTLTSDATNVSDGDTVTIDTVVYRFKNTLAQAFDVKIGADAAGSLVNLKKAINGSGISGTDYYAGTTTHNSVIATTITATTLVVQSLLLGTGGNSIATTETSSHLSWGGATLASGTGATGKIILNTFVSVAATPYRLEPMAFTYGLYVDLSTTGDVTVIYD